MAAPARPSLLRALRHRNYRLFFAGQSLSLVGTWITRIATSWLVYRLTGSALLLGIVGFCGQIPTLFLAPVAGVFVDRWDRHRVLVVTQALSALQSLGLAVLALSGAITVAQVLALQIVQGVINAFDTPARQAFVVSMIEDRADLPNAIALNSSMVNASRILGPSIGGVLIAAVGEGWCFLADAVSYLAVIASLLAMRIPPHVRTDSGDPGAGRAPDRLRVRDPLRAHPHRAAAPGAGEHDGHALHRADARRDGEAAARRAAHARAADDGVGLRRARPARSIWPPAAAWSAWAG